MNDLAGTHPKEVHGGLREGMHLAGYSFERACKRLDWLLDDDRWQQCGFDDINLFLETIDWSHFKIAASERKEIARKLAAIDASQRQIAKTLGVSQPTVKRDVSDTSASKGGDEPQDTAPPEEPSDTFVSPLTNQSGADAANRAEEKAKRPRSGDASHDNDDEWYTPPELISASRSALCNVPSVNGARRTHQFWEGRQTTKALQKRL